MTLRKLATVDTVLYPKPTSIVVVLDAGVMQSYI